MLGPTRVITALVVLAGAWSLPAAAAHGFTEPVRLGSETAFTTAAAVSASGAAVVAYPFRDGSVRGVEGLKATTRDASATTFRAPLTITLGAGLIRDVQTAVGTGGRLVVAWSEASSGKGQRIRAVDVTRGRLRFLADRPVAPSFSPTPRLAVTASGTVLLAWRDGARSATATLRLAALVPGARRFAATRSLVGGVTSLAITPVGSGAIVAWVAPPRRGHGPRAARAIPLSGTGARLRGGFLVSGDAAPEIRLASGAGGRALASWLRPATRTRPAAIFARAIAPVLGPARPLSAPGGGIPLAAAAIAGGPDPWFLAAAKTADPEPVGFGITAWHSRPVGGWVAPRNLVAESPMVGQPRVARTADGTGFVVITQARPDAAGGVSYDVRVATAPAGRTPEALQTVAGGLRTVDGRGLSVTAGGDRVLLAWPDPAGGVAVSER